MNVRQAAVAGMFYPDNPQVLLQSVATLLRDNPCSPAADSSVMPKVLIVPHAGYIYSGPVAARAYNRLRGREARIRRVLLLGPAHRVPLRGIALPDASHFATPLGAVPVDAELVRRVQGLPDVAAGLIHTDAHAHREEHSLEVHLPFLQYLLEDFTLLPLLVGECEPEQVAALLDQLWGGEETLVVVSSDLSHFHDYMSAEVIDQHTSAEICAFSHQLRGDEACGCRPLNGLLLAAQRKRMQIEQLDLRNSGDTGGDKLRVVGYGAYVLNG